MDLFREESRADVRSRPIHADCRAAAADDDSHKAVREVVARAVSDPAAVIKGLGEPKRAEIQKLYQTDELTIIAPIWGPRMTLMPHNHQMWAVIGIFTGREDNIFWRREGGGAARPRTSSIW